MPSPYDMALPERVVVAYEGGKGLYAQLDGLFAVEGCGHVRSADAWPSCFTATSHFLFKFEFSFLAHCTGSGAYRRLQGGPHL